MHSGSKVTWIVNWPVLVCISKANWMIGLESIGHLLWNAIPNGALCSSVPAVKHNSCWSPQVHLQSDWPTPSALARSSHLHFRKLCRLWGSVMGVQSVFVALSKPHLSRTKFHFKWSQYLVTPPRDTFYYVQEAEYPALQRGASTPQLPRATVPPIQEVSFPAATT